MGKQIDMAAIEQAAKTNAVTATNLLNQGLGPHTGEVAAAYRAALFVGASAEDAWEAARQHALMRAWQRLEAFRNEQPPKSDVRHWTGWDNKQAERREHFEGDVARLQALPNPFALTRAEREAKFCEGMPESVREVLAPGFDALLGRAA